MSETNQQSMSEKVNTSDTVIPNPEKKSTKSKFAGNTNTRPYKKNPKPKEGAQPQISDKTSVEKTQAHEAYLARLAQARDECLSSLCLPKWWLESKYEELHYMINERTGKPHDAIFLSVDKASSIAKNVRGEIVPLDDEVVVDNQKFSRDRFYRNRDFQNSLKDYYHELNFGCRLQERRGRWNLVVTW